VSQKVFRVTVRMLKPWSHCDFWMKKPTVDNVLENFAVAILNGKIDEIFQVEIKEVKLEAEKDGLPRLGPRGSPSPFRRSFLLPGRENRPPKP
jgi:hypothetical protein